MPLSNLAKHRERGSKGASAPFLSLCAAALFAAATDGPADDFKEATAEDAPRYEGDGHKQDDDGKHYVIFGKDKGFARHLTFGNFGHEGVHRI